MKRLTMLLAVVGVCTWALAGGPGVAGKSNGAGTPAKPGVAIKPDLPGAAVKSSAASKPADRYGPSVPTTRPDLSKMPRTLTPWSGVDAKAVELVKGVYANEDWVHRVKSFRIHVRRTSRTMPEGTAFNNKLFRERNRPSTRPTIWEIEFAFDDHRCRYSAQPVSDKHNHREVRIWDGKEGRWYDHWPNTKQEGYVLYSKPDALEFMMMFGGTVNWPRARRHIFWFDPEDKREDYYGGEDLSKHPVMRLIWDDHRDEWRRAARPEDFHIVGTQEYRGVECYVLEQRPAYHDYWRLYVGLETGLLHGTMIGQPSGANPDVSDSCDPRVFEIWAFLGYPAKTGKELWQRKNKLTRLEGYRLTDRYYSELRRRGFENEWALWNTTGMPSSEAWFMDYKEVAPGRYWPMRIGDTTYGLNAQGRLVVRETYDVRVQKIEVDADLPDSMFTMEFKEGLPVSDHRYDPPLRYQYGPGMPDEAMLAAWREERAKIDATIRERKAALDSLIGKPAPDLPAGGKWFNSKPLAWHDLRGQTVIVDFAFYACDDVRREKDKEIMTALFDRRDKTGLSVISIHPSSVSEVDLKDFIHWQDRQYPICRDLPGANRANSGATYERYQIAMGPYAFVVGPDGKVVHHGVLPDLPEVRAYCETLAPLPPTLRWTDGTRDESSETTTAPANADPAGKAETDLTDEELEEESDTSGLTVGVQMRPWRNELNFAGDYPPAPEEP